MQLILPDLAATARLAAQLARLVRGGDVLALAGDLGAGKTALARLLIQALTSPDMIVPSPTFTLVQEYAVDHPDIQIIYHYDLYRLDDSSALVEIGWDDVGGRHTLTLVEWPERAENRLDQGALWLFLHQTAGDDPDRRSLRLQGGADWVNRLGMLWENHHE